MPQTTSYKIGLFLGRLPLWAKMAIIAGITLVLVRACSTNSSAPSHETHGATTAGSAKTNKEPLTGMQAAPSPALPASGVPEKKAALPLKDDQNRIVNIDASVRDVEQSLTKYYGTRRQLEELKQLKETATVIRSNYQQNGTIQDHRNLSNKAAALVSRIEIVSRKVFASSLEEEFIKRGMDIRVSASGGDHKLLRIRYALMSQPLVYKFQNEFNLPVIARDLQFQKLIYTNGFESSLGETWTVDLKNK